MARKVEGEGLFSGFRDGEHLYRGLVWFVGVVLRASTMLEWLMQMDEVWWGWTNAGLALWGGC
jgi:hypothetical protein